MARLRLMASLTALALIFSAAPLPAQDVRAEAAKKEGKVVWYTSLALTSAQTVAKLFTAHPGYSGVIATHVLALVQLHGWDYFKQLAQNKPMLVQSAVDPSGIVASGERPVAVDGGDYTFYQVKKKGNPVEIVFPKEGVPLVVSPTAITSFAPHPNAAKLFTDFIFSRELQQVLADSEGLYTGHPDVKYPADRPKLSELKLLRVEPEELEKRNEEIKTRFVEFFGA